MKTKLVKGTVRDFRGGVECAEEVLIDTDSALNVLEVLLAVQKLRWSKRSNGINQLRRDKLGSGFCSNRSELEKEKIFVFELSRC